MTWQQQHEVGRFGVKARLLFLGLLPPSKIKFRFVFQNNQLEQREAQPQQFNTDADGLSLSQSIRPSISVCNVIRIRCRFCFLIPFIPVSASAGQRLRVGQNSSAQDVRSNSVAGRHVSDSRCASPVSAGTSVEDEIGWMNEESMNA